MTEQTKNQPSREDDEAELDAMKILENLLFDSLTQSAISNQALGTFYSANQAIFSIALTIGGRGALLARPNFASQEAFVEELTSVFKQVLEVLSNAPTTLKPQSGSVQIVEGPSTTQ